MRSLFALVLLSGCGPLTCQEITLGIHSWGDKPKPAGRVVLKCDGKAVLEAQAATVTTGSAR